MLGRRPACGGPRPPLPRPIALLILLVLASLQTAPAAFAQNRSRPWLVFDLPRADLELRHETLDITTSSEGTVSKLSQERWVEELNLRSGFSVFHPRLLDVDLSLGAVLTQADVYGIDQDTELTTWSVTAQMLKEHPYRFVYFTRRTESETDISATQAATSVQTARGGQIQLTEELGIPMPLVLYHDTDERRSLNLAVVATGGTTTINGFRRLDTRTERSSISSRKDWGAYDLRWGYEEGHRNYRQETDVTLATTEYDFRNYELLAGLQATPDSSFFWRLTADGRAQTDAPEFSDDRATLNVGGDLYDSWSNTLALEVDVRARREERDLGATSLLPGRAPRIIDTRSLGARMKHRLFRSLNSSLRARNTVVEHPSFTQETDAYGFGTGYSKSIPDGTVYASYDQDQATTVSEGTVLLPVFDEEHSVSGITPIQLEQPNIVLTDTERPVVTDISGAIIYEEGINYRVYQLGVDTFIEPLAGNPIPPGPVLVSYVYRRPPTDLTTRTERYTIGVRWRWFEPYWRIVRRDELITSDDPDPADVLLNPGSTRIYGIIYQQRIGIFEPVLQAENESNRFRLDPYERKQRDANLRVLFGLGLQSSVFRNVTTIDHVSPDRDDSRTTTTGADVTYARGRYRADFTLTALDRLRGRQSNEVLTAEARFRVYYGRWTLEVEVEDATERTADTSGLNPPAERNTLRTAVGVKAIF